MEKPGIVITGASGRMGQALAKLVVAQGRFQIVGAIEREGSAALGRDLGALCGLGELGVTVTDDPLPAFAKARALVDFTSPAASVAFAALAAQARLVHVVGTTGMEPEHHRKLDLAAHHAVVIQAGNMSLGVNLLTRLTQKIAEALDADWDIEIVEAHHRMKVDAPSGTALMLGEAAAKGRGIDHDKARVSGRDGITGAREKGTIGYSAIRGGDIVGEHDVIFAADGERIILRHIATDRALFARGALKAAAWGLDQKPGRYDMMDVLGL
nr:4-hydroxy-tetrahydrodipicolinate reductase [Stagnihabitans tardus]